MRTEIIHAGAVTPSSFISDAYIVIDGGRIQTIAPWCRQPAKAGARVVDASGMLASPGWIDIQLNGGFGIDFTELPEGIWEVGKHLPRFGTTSSYPQ